MTIRDGIGGPALAEVDARSTPEALAHYLTQREDHADVSALELIRGLADGHEGRVAGLVAEEDWRERPVAHIERLATGEVDAVIVAEVSDG